VRFTLEDRTRSCGFHTCCWRLEPSSCSHRDPTTCPSWNKPNRLLHWAPSWMEVPTVI